MSFSIPSNSAPNNVPVDNAKNSTDNKSKSISNKKDLLIKVILVVAHPILGLLGAIAFLFKAGYHKVSEKYYQKKHPENLKTHRQNVKIALDRAIGCALLAIPGFGAYIAIKYI